MSELIRSDKIGWRLEEAASLVSPDDLAMIRTIPISRFGCEDQRIWHYTKNGLYSVRSGYHVAMDMMKNGELGRKGNGMSSNSGTLGGVWKRIWSLSMPHKLRLFNWKACRKALAVKPNLERRQIRVVNKCDLCGVSDETEAHLFFDCDFCHISARARLRRSPILSALDPYHALTVLFMGAHWLRVP